jgi:hypothetical protein
VELKSLKTRVLKQLLRKQEAAMNENTTSTPTKGFPAASFSSPPAAFHTTSNMEAVSEKGKEAFIQMDKALVGLIQPALSQHFRLIDVHLTPTASPFGQRTANLFGVPQPSTQSSANSFGVSTTNFFGVQPSTQSSANSFGVQSSANSFGVGVQQQVAAMPVAAMPVAAMPVAPFGGLPSRRLDESDSDDDMSL